MVFEFWHGVTVVSVTFYMAADGHTAANDMRET